MNADQALYLWGVFCGLLGGIILAISVLWLAGFHIKQKPTADQLFGCSYAQTDTATGECR